MSKKILGLIQDYRSRTILDKTGALIISDIYHAKDGIIFVPAEPVETWKKVLAFSAMAVTPVAVAGLALGALTVSDRLKEKDYIYDITGILQILTKTVSDVIIVDDLDNCSASIDKRKFDIWSMKSEPREIAVTGNIKIFGSIQSDETISWKSDKSDDEFRKLFTQCGLKFKIDPEGKAGISATANEWILENRKKNNKL